MNVETTLDKMHAAATGNKLLQIFTAFTRLLLAVGFIPPSLKKILGQPFTVLPDSHPVGHYFNALYQTGFYYEFLGWAQLCAAILLIIPRTAHLGALAFFPIIVNIAVLTSSVGFAGTNYITALMALAAFYLVAWDYDRLKPILFGARRNSAALLRRETAIITLVFAFGGACLANFFAYFQVANFHQRYFSILIFLTVGGLIFGLALTLHHRHMTVGELKQSAEIV